MKIKVNETPIRTSRNFKINNVTIEAPEIKEQISEFKNVEISTVSSNYDEKVSNTSLIRILFSFLSTLFSIL